MATDQQLLIDTHGMVKEITGEIKHIKNDIVEAKDGRKRLHEKVDGLARKIDTDLVKVENCEKVQSGLEDSISRAVLKAMNGKKRARGLVIKDIIISTLGAGGIGTVLILYVLDKLK